MRPSIEIDSGLLVPPSQRSGTGRHTLPGTPIALRDRDSLGGMAEDFFSAGDDGSYEGAEAEPLEGVELEPVRVVVRSPEMEARRARGIRVVAGVVGCLTALLAFGVVRSNVPGEAVVTAPVNGLHHAEAAREPASIGRAAARGIEAAPAGEQTPRAAPAKPSTPVSAPAVARATSALSRALSPPVALVSPVRAAARPSVDAPPSVANFAARSGDSPKSAGRVPTASFAPAR